MIKLADSAVILVSPEGDRYDFDITDLQSRIIQSCLAAGEHDVWIAEDISLAIEYSLNLDENPSKVFQVTDINKTVVRLLQEIGYPAVAECFKHSNKLNEELVCIESDIIRKILNNNLGLLGLSLDTIAKKTEDNLRKIAVGEISPKLILELGKHYKDSILSDSGINTISLSSKEEVSFGEITMQDILSKLTDKNREIVDSGIISVSKINPLYPAIKINLRIIKFLEHLGLNPPITEMMFIPYFDVLADVINQIIEISDTLFKEQDNKSTDFLPIYLTVVNMSVFSEDWLNSPWPQSYSLCYEFLSYLERELLRGLFKLQLV
jgi:hypothetical protein